MRWAKVFRAGNHTSRQGLERFYPVSELHQAAEVYDPQKFKAPLLIDHDTKGVPDDQIAHKSFCYGFPVRFKVVGDVLKAGFEHIAPEFLEWVNNRNLIAVSPGFYLPEDPRNPTPGKLHPRHIAALGDKPPAIKNNGDLSELLVEYSEADSGLFLPGFTLEFEEYDQAVNLDGAALKNLLPVLESITRMAQAEDVDDQTQETIMTISPAPERAGSAQEFVSGTLKTISPAPDRLAAILAKGGSTEKEAHDIFSALGVDYCEFSEPEPTAQEKALAKRERELAEREAKLRHQAIADFVEPLIKDGKILPADKGALVAVLDALDTIQDVEYSEGDKSLSKAPAELAKEFLKRLPVQVEFSELTNTAENQDDDAPEFEEAPGYSVSRDRLKLHQKAIAYQKKHGGEYSAAVKAVGGK